jgi:uncharacterized protein (TIGR03435 family)
VGLVKTFSAVLLASVTAAVLTGYGLNGQGVAFVKVNRSGERRASLRLNGANGSIATNVPLVMLIASFYRMPTFRIVGGPDWVRSDRFDIVLTSGTHPSIGERRAIGRTLLEDRFKLKTHRETQNGRIYDLLLAREDRRLGPRLTPSTLDCPAILADQSQDDTSSRFRIREGEPPACAAVSTRRRVQGKGIQMGSLAASLGIMLRETVVDRTGLTGTFDVDMVVSRTPASDSPESPTRTERISAALQEQLGLKLEPAMGRVEVMVIDHVEHPADP